MEVRGGVGQRRPLLLHHTWLTERSSPGDLSLSRSQELLAVRSSEKFCFSFGQLINKLQSESKSFL